MVPTSFAPLNPTALRARVLGPHDPYAQKHRKANCQGMLSNCTPLQRWFHCVDGSEIRRENQLIDVDR